MSTGIIPAGVKVSLIDKGSNRTYLLNVLHYSSVVYIEVCIKSPVQLQYWAPVRLDHEDQQTDEPRGEIALMQLRIREAL